MQVPEVRIAEAIRCSDGVIHFSLEVRVECAWVSLGDPWMGDPDPHEVKVEVARVLGTHAHDTGRLRVPALDPQVLPLLREYKVGDGAVDLLEAWLAGWDFAAAQKRVALAEMDRIISGGWNA